MTSKDSAQNNICALSIPNMEHDGVQAPRDQDSSSQFDRTSKAEELLNKLQGQVADAEQPQDFFSTVESLVRQLL